MVGVNCVGGNESANRMPMQDMNPMGLLSEFTAATAPGPIAITPELFGGLPRSAAAAAAAAAAASLAHHHQTQLAFVDEQHQTILDHYGTLASGTINGMRIADLGNSSAEQEFDDDDDDEFGGGDSDRITSSTQVQHFDIGVGSDSASIHQQYDDENEEMGEANDEENSNDDAMEQYDDDCAETMDHSHDDNVYFQSADSKAVQSHSLGAARPFKKKTKSTQTTRKIKPVKRPGLVLKTPIAYQPCLDPSVIPIQRDGMGMFCIVFFSSVSVFVFLI